MIFFTYHVSSTVFSSKARYSKFTEFPFDTKKELLQVLRASCDVSTSYLASLDLNYPGVICEVTARLESIWSSSLDFKTHEKSTCFQQTLEQA